MESTSTAGSGPGMTVGNTLQAEPSKRPGQSQEAGVKPLIPVQPYEVTKMPLPKGDCSGHYTEAAREAGLEGVVIFDLVVDEHGKARDLTVVQGLGSGLTEAAKRALQACNFSPGERDGKPVPVRVRSFKNPLSTTGKRIALDALPVASADRPDYFWALPSSFASTATAVMR